MEFSRLLGAMVTSGVISVCHQRPLGPPTQTQPTPEAQGLPDSGLFSTALMSCCCFHSAGSSVHKESSLVDGRKLPYSFPVRTEGCLSLTVPWGVSSKLRSSTRCVTLRQVTGHPHDKPLFLLLSRTSAKIDSWLSDTPFCDSHKTHSDLVETGDRDHAVQKEAS